MASIVQSFYGGENVGEIWKKEQDSGTFERLEVRQYQVTVF